MPRSVLVRVGFLLLLAGPWAARPASGEWLEVRKILGADTAPLDHFGAAMALEGDRLAVGVPDDDSPLGDAGSVYLFERNQGGPECWGQVAKLTASDAGSSSSLGGSVALDGGHPRRRSVRGLRGLHLRAAGRRAVDRNGEADPANLFGHGHLRQLGRDRGGHRLRGVGGG
jgi:hypothetical protein